MSKTISVNVLSTESISNAIKEVEAYKQEVRIKAEILRKRVAERVAELAQAGFNGAIVDDLIHEPAKPADVKVYVENGSDISLVIAYGQDAVWVEFGAGVYHNPYPGTSRHPQGERLGMKIGEYKKGYGRLPEWGFRDDTGVTHMTHGTPAKMPMARAIETVLSEIELIAREVFS